MTLKLWKTGALVAIGLMIGMTCIGCGSGIHKVLSASQYHLIECTKDVNDPNEGWSDGFACYEDWECDGYIAGYEAQYPNGGCLMVSPAKVILSQN